MITVEIEDVPLMLDVIDTYLEGIREAKEMSIDDVRTLDSPEKLLDSMAQYDKDLDTLIKLKEKLQNGNGFAFFKRRRWGMRSH